MPMIQNFDYVNELKTNINSTEHDMNGGYKSLPCPETDVCNRKHSRELKKDCRRRQKEARKCAKRCFKNAECDRQTLHDDVVKGECMSKCSVNPCAGNPEGNTFLQRNLEGNAFLQSSQSVDSKHTIVVKQPSNTFKQQSSRSIRQSTRKENAKVKQASHGENRSRNSSAHKRSSRRQTTKSLPGKKPLSYFSVLRRRNICLREAARQEREARFLACKQRRICDSIELHALANAHKLTPEQRKRISDNILHPEKFTIECEEMLIQMDKNRQKRFEEAQRKKEASRNKCGQVMEKDNGWAHNGHSDRSVSKEHREHSEKIETRVELNSFDGHTRVKELFKAKTSALEKSA